MHALLLTLFLPLLALGFLFVFSVLTVVVSLAIEFPGVVLLSFGLVVYLYGANLPKIRQWRTLTCASL